MPRPSSNHLVSIEVNTSWYTHAPPLPLTVYRMECEWVLKFKFIFHFYLCLSYLISSLPWEINFRSGRRWEITGDNG